MKYSSQMYRQHKMTYAAPWLFLLVFVPMRIHAHTNFHKCIEITTFGYSYDSMFKVASSAQYAAEINFYVKSKSDAHVLLATTTDILDQLSFSPSTQKVVEVVIGNTRNMHSSIRSGLNNAKTMRIQKDTPNILSPDEFRGFWIKVSHSGFVTVGRDNSSEPFMEAYGFLINPGIFQPSYFGLSSWNYIKGHWKLNCPNETNTEISGMDDVIPKGLAKLQWDLTGLYDPNLTPEPKSHNEDAVIVRIAMQVHHLTLNEHVNEFKMGGKMFLSWYDARLRWYPGEYDNISSFAVHPSEVWTPVITAVTSKTGSQPILSDISSVGVFIQHNGTVQWTPVFQLSSFTIDSVTDNWPLDEFQLIVHLQSGVIGDFFFGGIETSKVDLKAASQDKWMILEVRSEWKVMNLTTSIEVDAIEGSEDQMRFLNRMMVVAFNVKRDSSPYRGVYVTPFTALAAMTLSSFWVKPHQGVRLYLHCISLVVLSSYIITLAEQIPAHTANVPVLFSLYTTSLMLSCVAIFMYVIAKNLRYCTWSIPYSWRLFLTHPLMENILLIRDVSETTEGEPSLESKDWNLINLLFDRLLFLVFFIVYIFLYTKAN